jgi:23S rRNA (cytidine1920-2'-O)/16S rRNA (cytidine1409-2'-O)-methyltransferase
VSSSDILEVDPGPRFVGRGGYKLGAALAAFGISVVGKACLDVGSSTGGFTDCLLQEGATAVVAVDVGRDQLAAELRHDPRVREMPATDIRSLTASDIEGPFPLVVVDVSFISVTRLAEALAAMTAAGGDAVILVKPQFEVGKEAVGRGVVLVSEEREKAVVDVVSAFVDAGFDSLRAMESPVVGEAGNREYFLWLRKR